LSGVFPEKCSEAKLKEVRKNRLYWGETIHFIYVTAQKQDEKGEDYGIKDGK
jgi:hypothetical protein